MLTPRRAIFDIVVAERRPRHWQQERYMEAYLGMRLHLMALAYGRAEEADLTRFRIYDRWAALYHAGQAGQLVDDEAPDIAIRHAAYHGGEAPMAD